MSKAEMVEIPKSWVDRLGDYIHNLDHALEHEGDMRVRLKASSLLGYCKSLTDNDIGICKK